MIVTTLSELNSSLLQSGNYQWVFSLGKFDGFHAGHHHLLHEMSRVGNKTAVLSFSNHPYSVINPSTPIKMVQTLEHRIECARRAGIDLFILEPFTLSMAELSYDQFLDLILSKIPFRHLVLGEGARFGKARAGDKAHVGKWCHAHGIEAHYIKKVLPEGQEVSSRTLREAIAKAATTDELAQVSLLLQRPYTLVARFQRYGDKYALSKHHLEKVVVPPIQNAHVRIQFEENTFKANLCFEPPFDFHLENLNLKIPAGIFEVSYC